jgi:hypothetical protein
MWKQRWKIIKHRIWWFNYKYETEIALALAGIFYLIIAAITWNTIGE